MSVSTVCFGGKGYSALRLSNQREIKTVHGRLIKDSMRTCETPTFPAEQKYKLLSEDANIWGGQKSIQINAFHLIYRIMAGEEMEKISLFLCIIYHTRGLDQMLLCFH